jgi:antitoxin HicB
MQYAYPATIAQDEDNRYLVTLHDFPEAATDGATLAEALAEARDLLRSTLAFRLSAGESIPEPSTAQANERLLGVPVAMALKVAVNRAFAESGISKTELARRLAISEVEARRILDPWHATKSDRLEDALLVLGGLSRLETTTA